MSQLTRKRWTVGDAALMFIKARPRGIPPGRCARVDKAYEELVQRVREEMLLTTIEALLEWDE